MAYLIDIPVCVGLGGPRVANAAVALWPGGEGVLGAPLLDVVAHQRVHRHVQETGLLGFKS